MRYHFDIGVTRKRHKNSLLLLGVAIVAMLGGIYLLFLATLAPSMAVVFNNHVSQVPAEPTIGNNRLYIPKLNVNLKINTGGIEALNDGVWHRYAERGDPSKGGNFIIAGHRFSIAFTPQDVVRKSPLYQLDKLEDNDKIYVDFSGKRYLYLVAKKYTVKPEQISIEAPSPDDPHMTLYTCTMAGESDGRLVIIARLSSALN